MNRMIRTNKEIAEFFGVETEIIDNLLPAENPFLSIDEDVLIVQEQNWYESAKEVIFVILNKARSKIGEDELREFANFYHETVVVGLRKLKIFPEFVDLAVHITMIEDAPFLNEGISKWFF